jgi:hypothetical protein
VEHCLLRSHLALLRSPYVWSDVPALDSTLATIGSSSRGLALSTTQSFEKAIASRSRAAAAAGSYPVFLNRKKRAALITYRHSGNQHFENAFVPQSNVNDL